MAVPGPRRHLIKKEEVEPSHMLRRYIHSTLLPIPTEGELFRPPDDKDEPPCAQPVLMWVEFASVLSPAFLITARFSFDTEIGFENSRQITPFPSDQSALQVTSRNLSDFSTLNV